VIRTGGLAGVSQVLKVGNLGNGRRMVNIVSNGSTQPNNINININIITQNPQTTAPSKPGKFFNVKNIDGKQP
jgi:hypothetical protein